ncbi:MAG: endonuclease/exonuclease/phosphatase family protein [Candidatus Polarisedimenticolia bacterium]
MTSLRPLGVVTWNIHGCIGPDGHRDPSRVARVLRALNADVVALQEVEKNGQDGAGHQSGFLAAALGMTLVEGPTRLLTDGHYGNALLTRLPIREERRLDLTVPGREPRGALDVDLVWGGRLARVITTHLGLNAWERHEQVSRLLEALDRNGRAAVTLVLGDFNTWFPGSRAARRLDERMGRGVAPPAWPAWRPLFHPDRIWADPRPALTEAHAHAGDLARRSSDHLPLRADVLPGMIHAL